ncbi:MAG: hypothetical protein J6B54_07150 [Clostridia bacterium]|nr:hypothetical protein [Clostridia bacterium]
MKLKHWMIILLSGVLCLGLVACGGQEQVPEITKEDLAAMTDDALIPVLLENYEKYSAPNTYSAEMSWTYRSGESVIASMTGTVCSDGLGIALTRTCTVGEQSKKESYVYSNGMCYISGSEKSKAAADRDEVDAYFEKLLPVFGEVSGYNFVENDLLRSEDGTYSLVLFLPANGIADSANITAPLTAAGNATAPVEMSNFSDIYLTLRFSAEGHLTGQTLGFDCKMTADGVETEGTVLLRFVITSTDATQPLVSVPQDADQYANADPNPFRPSDPVTDGEGQATSSDSQDATSDED